MLRVAIRTSFLVLIVVGVCSCATSPATYVLRLGDGSELQSVGWPKLNEATGLYQCQSDSGQVRLVPEKEVVEIRRTEQVAGVTALSKS